MGIFIDIHELKQYNPGTFNRGDTGEAKQINIGGVNRVRFSSQCQKRAIREAMALPEIRTSSVQNLIEKLLLKAVELGKITEDEMNAIGTAICSKEIIGTDCWSKRKSLSKEEKEDSSAGNVMVNTNAAELDALIETFINKVKEEGIDSIKDKKKWVSIVNDANLNNVYVSEAKAMFGNMATDGIIGTVDGAIEFGQAFSIDAYLPESDFFTATFSGNSGEDEKDPFFGVYEEYKEKESKKRNAETINQGLSLYSNTLYTYSNINLKALEINLNTFINNKTYKENTSTKDTIKEIVPNFIQEFINMVPSATQRRSSSHVVPSIVYIEVIKDGCNLQPDWNKVIKNKQDKSITEQGIEKLLSFATDTTFRTGEISKYVMISSDYNEYKEQFENAGIKVINSFDELNTIMKNEIDKLI